MINWIDKTERNLIIKYFNIDPVEKIDINSNFALQVGTTTKDLKIKDDIIMNDELPYVLVHQYDRNTKLNNLVINKYK